MKKILLLFALISNCKSIDHKPSSNSDVKRIESGLNSLDRVFNWGIFNFAYPRCTELVKSNCLHENIALMTKQFGTKNELKKIPWSGFWWARPFGLIGYRYQTVQLPNDWYSYSPGNSEGKNSYDQFFLPNYTIFENMAANFDPDKENLNQLSPAEKYDLLIRNNQTSELQNSVNDWPLSNWTWNSNHSKPGQKFTLAEKKNFTTWEGICHGWAHASNNLKEPLYPVTIGININGNKKDVTFYPADIKALLSVHYGVTRFREGEMAGGRCDRKNADFVNDEECFDINPGTWHKGVVNALAHLKTGIVADVNADFEVWNNPVQSYRFRYIDTESIMKLSEGKLIDFNIEKFNGLFELGKENYTEVEIDVKQYENDPYKSKRPPSANKIVGVVMEILIAKEPSEAKYLRGVTHYHDPGIRYLLYDLEIDASGKIIGGEWYSKIHPDFIWRISPEDDLKKFGEQNLLVNSATIGNLDDKTREFAAKKAENGSPLYSILQYLNEAAQKNYLANQVGFYSTNSKESLKCLPKEVKVNKDEIQKTIITKDKIGNFMPLNQAATKGFAIGEDTKNYYSDNGEPIFTVIKDGNQTNMPLKEACKNDGPLIGTNTGRKTTYNQIEKVLAVCEGLEQPNWVYCQGNLRRCMGATDHDYCVD